MRTLNDLLRELRYAREAEVAILADGDAKRRERVSLEKLVKEELSLLAAGAVVRDAVGEGWKLDGGMLRGVKVIDATTIDIDVDDTGIDVDPADAIIPAGAYLASELTGGRTPAGAEPCDGSCASCLRGEPCDSRVEKLAHVAS